MSERGDGLLFCQRTAFHIGNTHRLEVTGSEDESTVSIDCSIRRAYGLWHLWCLRGWSTLCYLEGNAHHLPFVELRPAWSFLGRFMQAACDTAPQTSIFSPSIYLIHDQRVKDIIILFICGFAP